MSAAQKERNEEANFRAFLETQAGFAGRPIKDWQRGGDPPDVLCLDSNGERIGVELMQWVNEQQMAVSKARYALEESYLRIIRSPDESPPENLGLIWLRAKDRTRLDPTRATEFREELYGCVRQVNDAWSLHPEWNDPQGYDFEDFTGYPCLAQHLDGLHFMCPQRFKPGLGAEWITFPAHGGAYTPLRMRDALLENVRKKIMKYSQPQNQQKLKGQQLDEFHLLAYYDEAVLHNSPYHAPGVGFREIAGVVARELATTTHPFDKVFLFSPIEKSQKVLQVWPTIE